MLDDQIIKQILGKINRKVKFVYPTGEPKRQGRLTDRVVDRANPNEKGVPYWSVVDLINFDERHGEWIRFGYYRKPKDRLNWASQTTATFPIEAWKRLFIKAAKEKTWFRELLNEVMDELPRDTTS